MDYPYFFSELHRALRSCNIQVSRDTGGRYFVSFACEVAIQPLPLTGKAPGFDLGIKDVVVGSDGYRSGNPKHLKYRLRHLKPQQR